MRKIFTPLALLFGLLTAMLLGSTAVAQANPILTLDGCSNQVVDVNVVEVNCNDVLNNVVVKITQNRVLTGNELTILKDNLNDADIDINILNITTTLEDIEAVTLDVYDSFNPSVVVGDINLCIASVCY